MKNKRLYVGNLNYEVSENELRELFSQYGEVESVNIIEGKGFGFVEMNQLEDASKAMESLNGQEFRGRTLKIDEAKPRRKRFRNNTRRFY